MDRDCKHCEYYKWTTGYDGEPYQSCSQWDCVMDPPKEKAEKDGGKDGSNTEN